MQIENNFALKPTTQCDAFMQNNTSAADRYNCHIRAKRVDNSPVESTPKGSLLFLMLIEMPSLGQNADKGFWGKLLNLAQKLSTRRRTRSQTE